MVYFAYRMNILEILNMANTGRTGADALFKWAHNSVHTLGRYNTKVRTAVTAAIAAGVLTSAEGAVIIAYFDTMAQVDAAMKKLADYCGFEH